MTSNIINTPLKLVAKMEGLRMGIRNRLIKLFCDHNKVINEEFEMDFYGYKYRGNFNCYIDWCAYYYGAYEKQDLQVLVDLAAKKKHSVFVDVGANIGHHSLFMSQYCSQVHSFEPYDVVRKKLEEKISINNIENITIYPVGLGEEQTELEFFAPHGSNTGTGSFVSSHEVNNNESIGKLSVVNGDEFINNLNIPKIDIIKIDVEGFEKNVLKGLAGTIAKHRPSLMVEYLQETRASFSGFDEFKTFFPEDYQFKKIISNRKKLIFFNKPHYILEDFDFNSAGGNLLITPTDMIP